MNVDIDWEPPAPPARGVCDMCDRRRVVFETGLCLPCTKDEDARYERDRQAAQDLADGLYDAVLFGDLLERHCFFESDGPG